MTERWVVNIPTPDTLELCETLKDYVDNLSDDQISVNREYGMVMDAYEMGNITYRPGFDFKFWFVNEEDANDFAIVFEGIISKINN